MNDLYVRVIVCIFIWVVDINTYFLNFRSCDKELLEMKLGFQIESRGDIGGGFVKLAGFMFLGLVGKSF